MVKDKELDPVMSMPVETGRKTRQRSGSSKESPTSLSFSNNEEVPAGIRTRQTRSSLGSPIDEKSGAELLNGDSFKEESENEEENDKDFNPDETDETNNRASSESSDSSNEKENKEEKDELEREIGVLRRSGRKKISVYPSLNPHSWILGGGPHARGYPTERAERHHPKPKRHLRSTANMNDDVIEKKIDIEEEEEVITRRSTRRSISRREGREVSEEENDERGEGEENEEDEDEDNTLDANSHQDLYSRVKSRLRRSTVKKNYNENYNSRAHRIVVDDDDDDDDDDDEVNENGIVNNEPVCRRLRDRSKISKSAQSFDHSGSRSRPFSKINKYLHKRRMKKYKKQRRKMNSFSSSSSSSSSTSSSDSDEPSQTSRKSRHPKIEKNCSKKRLSKLELQPLNADPTVSFESIGGLDHYITKLKEIVFLPLLYRQYFESRNIKPARGILFHGPPGTGKTLLARALSNECSKLGNKKVSFFMRKGADILNKWVGESERQLKLLFEQASEHQPSIIFFDEIDGLAPVRSSKTDQIHNSIVSTLLAEMDGLKDRGDVLVIGATNRVDAVDPALRRPGRFDHEFPFFLPSQEGRREIIKVHISKWKNYQISDVQLDHLSDECVGFSGADLRFLCAEANLIALRRRYPQIYSSTNKYLIDYDSIKVERCDWIKALKSVSRSSDRSVFSISSPGMPLPDSLKPLFSNTVANIVQRINTIFPWNNDVIHEPSPKKFLISEYSNSLGLNEYIAPAILHSMESITVYTLSIETLALKDAMNDHSAIAQILGEASRQFLSILYIPSIEAFWEILSDSAKQVMLNQMNKNSLGIKTQLWLATTSCENWREEFDEGFKEFFKHNVEIGKPNEENLLQFFEPIFKINALNVRCEPAKNLVDVEELPLAPPSPVKKSNEEIAKIERKENNTLRQLRIFLREIIAKLARNKKFTEFTSPVDINEVPDYLNIIENPMDLETMMCKLDYGNYMSAKQFLGDIELITANALNYNPSITDTDKRIRHRAQDLRDTAQFLIEAEMDSDFEMICQDIVIAREKRTQKPDDDNGNTTQNMEEIHLQNGLSTTNGLNSETPIRPEGRRFKRLIIDESSASSTQKKKRKKSWKGKRTIKKYKSKATSSSVKTVKIENLDENANLDKMDIESSGDTITTNETETVEIKKENGLQLNGVNGNHIEKEETISAAKKQEKVFPSASSGNSKKTTPTPPSPILKSPKSKITQDFPDEFGFVKCPDSKQYLKSLGEILKSVVHSCKNYLIPQLLEVRFHLLKLCEYHYDKQDKNDLIKELKSYANSLEAERSPKSLKN